MAFTIKYRTFQPAAQQSSDANIPTFYDTVEQISGPYAHVSQEMQDGYMVVYAADEHGDCRCTFGPYKPPEAEEFAEYEKQCSLAGQRLADPPAPLNVRPRPTLWVMNDNGATVAKYDL